MLYAKYLTIRSEKQILGGVYAYNDKSLNQLAYFLAGLPSADYAQFYSDWLAGLYPRLPYINEDVAQLTPLENDTVRVQLGFNEYDGQGNLVCFIGSKAELIDVFQQWVLLVKTHEHVDHFLVIQEQNKLSIKAIF